MKAQIIIVLLLVGTFARADGSHDRGNQAPPSAAAPRRPIAPATSPQIQPLIEALDSEEFTERRDANAELQNLMRTSHDATRQAIQAALAQNGQNGQNRYSPEATRRMQHLLDDSRVDWRTVLESARAGVQTWPHIQPTIELARDLDGRLNDPPTIARLTALSAELKALEKNELKNGGGNRTTEPRDEAAIRQARGRIESAYSDILRQAGLTEVAGQHRFSENGTFTTIARRPDGGHFWVRMDSGVSVRPMRPNGQGFAPSTISATMDTFLSPFQLAALGRNPSEFTGPFRTPAPTVSIARGKTEVPEPVLDTQGDFLTDLSNYFTEQFSTARPQIQEALRFVRGGNSTQKPRLAPGANAGANVLGVMPAEAGRP